MKNCRECNNCLQHPKCSENGLGLTYFCGKIFTTISDLDDPPCEQTTIRKVRTGAMQSMEVKVINIPHGREAMVIGPDGEILVKSDEKGNITYPEYKEPEATEKRNKEGYPDPTAYSAIQNVEQLEDKKFRRLIRGIFNLCDLAGFEIQGRVVFKSRKTGRLWK